MTVAHYLEKKENIMKIFLKSLLIGSDERTEGGAEGGETLCIWMYSSFIRQLIGCSKLVIYFANEISLSPFPRQEIMLNASLLILLLLEVLPLLSTRWEYSAIFFFPTNLCLVDDSNIFLNETSALLPWL